MLKDIYPQRQRTRLDPALYADVSAICSLTVCTIDRAPVFRDVAFAEGSTDLLISPSEEESVIDFVRELKSLSTRMSWRHGLKGKIWQQGFYDHFLRRCEDVELAARYILSNPIRKGMVQDWHAYPYCGSLVYNL